MRSSAPRLASSLRLLVIIALAAFTAEALIMLTLRSLVPPLGIGAEAVLDSALLVALLLPALYFFMVRPLELEIAIRQKSEAALQEARAELEGRVQERTAELAQANQTLQVEIAERKQIEEDLLNTLADSRQRQTEIAALLTGAQAVLEHRDFEKAAQAIFNSCKNLLGAKAGYVALLTKDGKANQVVFLDPGGLGCAVDPALPMPIRGLRAQACRTGQTVYDNDFLRSEWVPLLPEGHLALNNVLLAPLNIEGKTVGLLGLANRPGGFDENNARMASAFGELAAVALLNSRALESLETSEAASRRARDELEQRVQDRTAELARANDALRAEIGDRKRIEEELRTSEEIFRQLAENVREVFWVTTPDRNRMIYISPIYEELWGRTRESLYQQPGSFMDAVLPEDRLRLETAFGGRSEFGVEYRITRPDGSIRWIRSRGFPVRNVKGEVYRIAGITEDVTERVQAFQLLEQRVQERTLKIYEQAQHLAALEERQHLARELHDSLSQTLYSIALGAHTALTFLDNNQGKTVEALNYVLSLADAGLTEMRALIFNLRPESLEVEGLASALTKQAAALQTRYDIAIRTEICEEPDVPLETKEAVYRIAQEALNNAVKHAQANWLMLWLCRERGHLVLEVNDDGVGFDSTKAHPGHFGLNSMRERASRLRGQLEVQTAPGCGTRVRAEFPLSL